MNIFYLDEDPVKCAKYHCDKHVPKMILESAQMICTVLREFAEGVDHEGGLSDFNFNWGRYNNIRLYKATHRNHPCTRWLLESRENYRWLMKMVEVLNEEYKKRFDHKEDHKSFTVIKNLPDLSPVLPGIPFTRPAEAMPDEYKSVNPVDSYRNYYLGAKSSMLSWKTEVPKWIS